MLMEIIIGTDTLLKRGRLLKFLFCHQVDSWKALKTLEKPPNLEKVTPFGGEDTGILPTHINLGESDEDTVQSLDFVYSQQAPNPLPSSIGKGKALEEQPPVVVSQFHGVDVIRECQNQISSTLMAQHY
ncbi:hypothetical protein M9H77_12089 [Catharanthus roseus]|uniref:Uncharacterized protein n=1 Tax=Catharanthus roseus TaxID=4058 RepID=A0ACC0BGG2_CATRO|nr:hypothetical protein M9H77_12089 [Catharanthus roseus]